MSLVTELNFMESKKVAQTTNSIALRLFLMGFSYPVLHSDVGGPIGWFLGLAFVLHCNAYFGRLCSLLFGIEHPYLLDLDAMALEMGF